MFGTRISKAENENLANGIPAHSTTARRSRTRVLVLSPSECLLDSTPPTTTRGLVLHFVPTNSHSKICRKRMPNQKIHDDCNLGWICALPLERAAAKLMLDNIHPNLSQPPQDNNSYLLGDVNGHNVVVACLPSGIYGTISAAVVASQMLSTYHKVRFGLMVGIGGGVPSATVDIRLGDIVVSKPTGVLPGVVQYDLARPWNWAG